MVGHYITEYGYALHTIPPTNTHIHSQNDRKSGYKCMPVKVNNKYFRNTFTLTYLFLTFADDD